MRTTTVHQKLGLPVRMGLPALLDGKAYTDGDETSRFLKRLDSVRAGIIEAWTGAGSLRRRRYAICAAVDDLISLTLLTEFVRQRDSQAVRCLQEAFEHTRRPSPRRLFAAMREETSCQLLKPVFTCDRSPSALIIPRSVRQGDWLASLSDAIRESFPVWMPVSVFGAFHLFCVDHSSGRSSVLETRSRRVSPRRHANGMYYTPASLVDYLTYSTLEQTFSAHTTTVSGLRILDPACGCGAFLIASLRYLIARQAQWQPQTTHRSRGSTGDRRWLASRAHLTQLLDLLGSVLNGVDTDARATEWTRRCLLLTFWESVLDGGLRDMPWARLRVPDLKRSIVQADFLGNGRDARMADRSNLRQKTHVILGAPPFVRVEQLHTAQPDKLPDYRRIFRTARVGQFDLYMLFVERALEQLSSEGLLGFSVSGSFLRSCAGQTLRELISREARVTGVIEFERRNIYPDSTSHICLLSICKGGQPARTRHALVKKDANVRAILGNLCGRRPASSSAVEVRKPRIRSFTSDVWGFESLKQAQVLARMEAVGTPLAKLPVDVRLGVCTGADNVFVLQRKLRVRRGLVQAVQQDSGRELILESSVTRPMARGRDLSSYAHPRVAWVCVYPYDRDGAILDEKVFQARHPKAFEYLKAHRHALHRCRRNGSRSWYALSRPAPPCSGRTPAVVAGVIGSEASFTIDQTGRLLCHQTVVRISPAIGWIDPFYLLGVLNTRIIWMYIRHRMPVVGPGRYALRVGRLRRLPVPLPRSADQAKICGRIAHLAKQLVSKDSRLDPRRRRRQEIEDLVVGLYDLGGHKTEVCA